jgi:hypothetical protein
VNLLAKAQRGYRLLEHLGTDPVVVYLKKVDPNAAAGDPGLGDEKA